MAAHSKPGRPGQHRKPKPRSHRRTAVQTAGVLALAGAATALGGPTQAEPRPTPAEVKARVDRLHHEAEEATERYNGAKERTDRAERRIARLQDTSARGQEELNTARTALGSLAASQYRSGGVDPALQLALSAAPGDYLDRAERLSRAGDRQARQLAGIGRRMRALEQLRDESEHELTELRRAQSELRAYKKTVEDKLTEARRLLETLTPAARAAVLAEDASGAPADRSLSRGALAAPSPRAAAAVAYAMAQLGKPYVWGATGPDSYDCSGLTQAAWRAGGVSLPRTTYTQINAGQRISRSELAPGDLVFFYSGVSHVGMYIGGGQMVHAPRPGTVVRVAPIDQMPFAGAMRPS
ncbi:NlpC/P60 family protein [Streptomyces sp. NPDC051940]|uniref:C40 family peptidase n=1 Tax=Streptomyces sp. NPDC051940 TaxID=3155675 RepID=UPI003444260F